MFGWRVGSGQVGRWATPGRLNASGQVALGPPTSFQMTDVVSTQAGGTATANAMSVKFEGAFTTGTAQPCFCILQWAQNNTSAGTATSVLPRSHIRARRII